MNPTQDQIIVTAVHTDTLQVDLSLTVNGVTYVDTLPILNLGNGEAFTKQLQAFAQEERAEIEAVQAAQASVDATAAPVVDPSVTALIGTVIPVDVAPTTPTDGTTTPPTDTTTAPADGTTPTDETTPTA